MCFCVISVSLRSCVTVSDPCHYHLCHCVSDLWPWQEAWQSHPVHDVSVSQIFGPGKKLGSLILFTMCLLIITSCVSLQLFCSIKDFHKFETFPQVRYYLTHSLRYCLFLETFPQMSYFFRHSPGVLSHLYVLMVFDMALERIDIFDIVSHIFWGGRFVILSLDIF